MGVNLDNIVDPPADKLPATYDKLLHCEELIHGTHNPRNVCPTDSLRESLKSDGFELPLIVHPDSEEQVYHIVDGWQRYQAATGLGWEVLPADIYNSELAALKAAEHLTIGRDWTRYDWANYYQSVASEVDVPTGRSVASVVAEQVNRNPQTVRQYLRALSLPEVIHPLLRDGPDGTNQQWQVLKNYNEDVRRYKGLSWQVGSHLGKYWQANVIDKERLLHVGTAAVEYDAETAESLIDLAVENPETPLQTIQHRVHYNGAYEECLTIPQLRIEMSEEQKRAIMNHCAENRETLSSVVAKLVTDLAVELRSK